MLREMLLNLRDAVDAGDKPLAEQLYRKIRTSFGMDRLTADFLLKNRRLWEAE